MPVSQRTAYPAPSLHMMHKSLPVIAMHWIKMRGLHLTVNWNNSLLWYEFLYKITSMFSCV